MRILFLGTAPIALPTLQRLSDAAGVEIVAVITQPDRKKGRKQVLSPTPVKEAATALGLPVLTPVKVGAADSVEAIRAGNPDLIVVVAYGQYIPASVLGIPPRGAINLHPSLLPKYRGAAPIQMAVVGGETETGVSIITVAEEMDAGDILLQEAIPIDPEDTAETLEPRLAELGASLTVRAVELIASGEAVYTPQRHEEATVVYRLTKDDGRIDWRKPAEVLRNQVRGFVPWPGSFCHAGPAEDAPLKIWKAGVCEGSGEPGEVLAVEGEGPVIATGEGALILLELQPPGKRRMDGRSFLNGNPLQPGDRLG